MHYLNKLKESYLKVDPPFRLKTNGWESVLLRIDENGPLRPFWFKSFAFALASILVFAGGLFGLYTVAKASIPGEALYPVKRFAEGFLVKATGKKEIVTQNRAQEIVDLAKKKETDTQKLNETVTEYVKAVSEVKKIFPESENKQRDLQKIGDFERKLEEQHRQFDELSRDRPEIKSDIREAIRASEVKPAGD